MTFAYTPAGSSEGLLPTLRARLAEARRQTDALFGLVRPGALLDRPIPARHRILFYLGHLEAFDANLLLRDSLRARYLQRRLRPPLRFRHRSRGGRPAEGRPARLARHRGDAGYDARARAGIDAALTDGSIENGDPCRRFARDGPSRWPSSIDSCTPRRWPTCSTSFPTTRRSLARAPGPGGDAPHRALIEIPAGRATLGTERGAGPGLGWDNEYEAHVGRRAGIRHRVPRRHLR